MKMRNFKLLSVLILALGFVFSSCDDDIRTSALTIDMQEEATITAYFYAELNKKDLGLEFAPNGTQVIVSVSYKDLNSNAGAGNWMDTVAVQNGRIVTTVPATSAGVSVELLPAEFVYDQVQEQGADSETIRKIFKVTTGTTIADVKPGQNRHHQVTYNSQETFRNFEETVVARIRAQGVFNEEDGDVVDVPNGTSVTVFTTGTDGKGWSATTTVGANGLINLEVPKGMSITFEFIAGKRVVDADHVTGFITKTHKFSTTRTFSAYNPVAQTITFASELWQ